jgi:hypothetical protein
MQPRMRLMKHVSADINPLAPLFFKIYAVLLSVVWVARDQLCDDTTGSYCCLMGRHHYRKPSCVFCFSLRSNVVRPCNVIFLRTS